MLVGGTFIGSLPSQPFYSLLWTSLWLGIIALASRWAIKRFNINLEEWRTSEKSPAPHYSAIALLSPGEHSFLTVLELAVRGEYRVFAKVRLADIIAPSRTGSRSDWQRNFNRISCKHVDFVLCNSKTLDVLAVVELDDKTHSRLERSMRDAFVDAALKSAKIPTVRVQARRGYSSAELRDLCATAIGDRGHVSQASLHPLAN